jgi:pimeloyl-ACP methyl ester carboxylesterase
VIGGEEMMGNETTEKPTRRTVVGAMAAGAGAMAASGGAIDPALAQQAAKTFVLVHGAWHGGWCWRRVADRLEKGGHRVFAPTMTGLGERSHLIDLKPDLTMHITDIVNVIKWENLSDIVLVGHSNGGFIISGVAEKIEPAIASLVFLDAFVPENGESLAEIASPRVREGIQAILQKGELSMAPPKAAFFQVNEKDRAWVDEKCTPQPVGTLTQKIALGGARERIAKKAYVRAKGYGSPGFDAIHAKLQTNPAWRVYEMPSGHDAMVDMPDRLVEILLEVA